MNHIKLKFVADDVVMALRSEAGTMSFIVSAKELKALGFTQEFVYFVSDTEIVMVSDKAHQAYSNK